MKEEMGREKTKKGVKIGRSRREKRKKAGREEIGRMK